MTLLLLLPFCVPLRPQVCSLLGNARKCSLAWQGETCPTLPSCPGHLSPDFQLPLLKDTGILHSIMLGNLEQTAQFLWRLICWAPALVKAVGTR